MLGTETRIDPREYDLFIGMDVDKKRISNSVLDHGAFMKTVSLVNEPTMLKKRNGVKSLQATKKMGSDLGVHLL